MIGADDRREVLQAFLARGRLSSARVLGPKELTWGKSHALVAAVEGAARLGDHDVTLRIGVCPRFPLALPHIFAVLPEAVGTIPHIERDGRTCYLSKEGLLIDQHAPVEVLEEALDAAIQTLAKGLSGENWHDFLNELEAHWRHLATGRPLAPASYVEADDTLRAIQAGEPVRRKLSFVADSFDAVRAFMNEDLRPPPLRRAFYIPLQNSVMEERFTPNDFRSLEWTRSFVHRHLSENNRKELLRLRVRNRRPVLVVLGVPRPKGGKGLVGLEYRDVSGGNPLLRGVSPHPPRFVFFERRDRAVTMARVEDTVDLRKKHVAIAGCGAVGGHLAFMLARAGVGRLSLIDPDRLQTENTFRHVLGRSAIGQLKVYALKRELSRQVPYVEIGVHAKNIEDVLETHAFPSERADLLVYATGDITVGLHISERMHGGAGGPAALFTWLEPYGLGGHALLTNTRHDGGRGCFACLFDSPIKGQPRHNRADFAGSGQHFAKDVSGCAAMYTPYADLDAVRTAELATRLALDFLRGRAVGHPLLSWKGDGDAFRAAGFRTSDRHGLSEQELYERRLGYARESCTVCGGTS